MDKNELRIKIQHNRFTRFVITSVCKIMIWSILISTTITVLQILLVTRVLETNPAFRPEPVYMSIALLALVYIIVFISTLSKIISAHRTLYEEKEKILDSPKNQ